jgi:hypothetical protein
MGGCGDTGGMMDGDIIQIQSVDGCVYVYNVDTYKIKKVRDIVSEKDLPQDVLRVLDKLHRGVRFDRE